MRDLHLEELVDATSICASAQALDDSFQSGHSGIRCVLHHSVRSELLDYYLDAASAANTRRAYQADLAHFLNWGGSVPSTDGEIAEYLAAHAGTLAVSTLQRRLAALATKHKAIGAPNPCGSELVRLVMRGIKRIHGVAQRRVDPLLLDDIAEICATMGDDLHATRDRALLQIGFAGALRRAELVAIRCSDLARTLDGMTITILRSKTDPFGAGRKILIAAEIGSLRPVAALYDWLDRAGIGAGTVFRSFTRTDLSTPLAPGSLSLIVKRRAAAAGYNPNRLSGHSLRCGYVTTAAQRGEPIWKIRRHTAHQSLESLLRYMRECDHA